MSRKRQIAGFLYSVSKRACSPLFPEQLAFILFFAIVLSLGLGWGLPNERWMELLTLDVELSQREKDILTSYRQKFYERLDSVESKAGEILVSGGGSEFEAFAEENLDRTILSEERLFLNEEDKVIALRTYIFGSQAVDEKKPFSALSRMEPQELDFDPKIYIYGGAFLYPIGGLLFLLQSFGVLQVSNDYVYYLGNPSQIALLYKAGRLPNLLALLGILTTLSIFGNKLKGRMTGSLAAGMVGLSYGMLSQTLVTKPHVYAAFWTLLGVYCLYLYAESKKRRYLVLSAIGMGWAVGSSVVVSIMTLIYPITLLDFHKLKESLVKIIVACLGMVAVFFLTNPYAILNFERYYLTVFMHTSADSLGGYNYGAMSLANIASSLVDLASNVSFSFIVFVLVGLGHQLFVGERFLKRLAIALAVVLVVVVQTNQPARLLLFVIPLLSLLGGHTVHSWFTRVREKRSWKRFSSVLVCLVLLPGVVVLVLFLYELLFLDMDWYGSTKDWVYAEDIGQETSVGVYGLGPVAVPPFPFFRAKVANLAIEQGSFYPDYIVINRQHLSLWASHPLRPEYRLTHYLGADERLYNYLVDSGIYTRLRPKALVYTRGQKL